MLRRHILRLLPVLLATVCGALPSATARADGNAGTVRFFLEFLPDEGEEQDWESPGSRRIVVQYSRRAFNDRLDFRTWDYETTFPENYQIYDADRDVVLDLSYTTWVRMPVLHVTDEGATHVRSVYWLVNEGEDADDVQLLLAGATAATGPDGDVGVVTETAVWSLSDGSLFLAPGRPIRISMGVFDK
jgi:hypothetical protein